MRGGGGVSIQEYLGGKRLIHTSIWVSIRVEKQQSQRQTEPQQRSDPQQTMVNPWYPGLFNNSANKPALVILASLHTVPQIWKIAHRTQGRMQGY